MSAGGCATDTIKLNDFCYYVETPIYYYNDCKEPVKKRIDEINLTYEKVCQ